MPVLEDRTSKIPSKAGLVATRRNERLGRRIKTLFMKSHELWELFGVDVAVVFKTKSLYYTYKSIENSTWPPTMADVVGINDFICARLT